MFQVEPILWLQGFSSAGLTWLMWAISQLGYTPVYAALILGLAFGVRLRAALGVLFALLVVAVLTDALKNQLRLPRPSDVDTRVLEPGDTPPTRVADAGGAPSFWSLPTDEALRGLRAQPDPSYGFPSGHVSSAAAVLVAIALLWRSRRLAVAAVIWPILMAVSRMYLGRHFLADALGGLVLGALTAGAAVLLWTALERQRRATLSTCAALVLGAAAVLVLVSRFPILGPENAGRLAGLALALAALLLRGFPGDDATVRRRAGRVLLAGIAYVVFSRVIGSLFDLTGWENAPRGEALAATLVISATLLAGVEGARALGWYAAPASPAPAAAPEHASVPAL